MSWAAALPAVASVIGGVLGADRQSKGLKSQERQLDALTDEWRQINLPELSPVQFEAYKDLFKAQEVGDTAYDQISVDPRLAEAQMQALGGLQDIVDRGGMTLQDQVNFENIQQELARQDSANQAAMQMQMAARGLGGSGQEMAQRMLSSQGAANRASQAGSQMAADAQARALQALMQGGQLAGDIRGQEFGEQSERARAQDIINQFNARQRQQEQQVLQQQANMRTDQTNLSRQQANQLEQMRYDNERARMAGIQGVAMPRAQIAANRGMMEGQAIGALGSALGQAGGAMAAAPGGAATPTSSIYDKVAQSPTVYAGPALPGDAPRVNAARGYKE